MSRSASVPTISVIVATYNAAAFIGDALDSVLRQTLADLEVIVVDDASTDATRTVLAARAAADPRLRLVALTENGGPGRARNAGLARARGEWIAVLDADDAFAPDRLTRLLALARVERADLVADNLRLLHEDRAETLLAPEGDPLTLDALAFIAGNRGRRGQGRNLYGFLKPLIRRSFLEQHGLRYPEIRLAEDYFLALECLIHGARFVVGREALYDYRVRGDSLTATYGPAHLDAMARVDGRLLGLPALGAEGPLRRAIQDHRAAVERAATWTRFVGAVRRRDLGQAGAVMCRNGRALRDVLAEGAGAAPRVVARTLARRLWAPGHPPDAHTGTGERA